MYFEYKVLIVYREFTKEYIKQEFKLFAKDEENARKIAKEILYLKSGNPIEDLQFVVKLVAPNIDTQGTIQQLVKPLVNKVCDLYVNKDYSFFIDAFIKYSGYAAKFDRKHKIKEYICSYEDIDIRITYDFEKNMCVVDKDYIILYRHTNTYFLTNDLKTIINCKV